VSRLLRTPLGWLLAAAAAPLAAVGLSVAFVRISSAGRIVEESVAPARPVALVLGARVSPGGVPSPFLAARLDVARRLFQAGRVRVIIVSGDHLAKEYNEPEAMRAYLVEHGVPTRRIVTDYAGLDTYDSCARARRIFGVDRLLIVSQDYHLPRAVATARWLGLDAIGVPDRTRRGSAAWQKGLLRDQVACVKTVLDLLSRRDPLLGPVEAGVQEALREGAASEVTSQ
jgi:vancomycin permeability regulator SanA